MDSSKRKAHVSLTSEKKLQLLDELKNGCSQSDVAKKYGIDRTTVSKIKGQEEKLPLLTWCHHARSENIPLNGPILLEKAQSLAIQMNSDFVSTKFGALNIA